MERARVEFFLDRDTLIRVINSLELDGDTITIGVKQSEITTSAKEIISILTGTLDFVDGFMTQHKGITILVKIYPNDIPELKNLDTKVYLYESFKIPNPITTFLKKGL